MFYDLRKYNMTKLKSKNKLFLIISLIGIATWGCDDMLDVKSDRFQKTDEYTLNASNEGIYAMSGIFNQLQKVAERYVILGELRGDLMDVTPDASVYLKEINNFEITPDNPYDNLKDYYSIINNCNYLIRRIDTSAISDGIKAMYQEYAATKAIRAWTYMQIALNYGTAVYYEDPILSIDDASKDYPKYNITELANVLIPDLLPWKDTEMPGFGQIGELNSSLFYIPIRFILGELYLWSGQYESAANEYHDLIVKEKIRSFGHVISWKVVNGEFLYTQSTTYSDEILSEIGTTSEHGEGSNLKGLSGVTGENYLTILGKNSIKPSDYAISYWDTQIYYDSDTANKTEGDLRGRSWSYYSLGPSDDGKSSPGYDNYIYKYYYNNDGYDYSEVIPTCNSALVYLRYAEAVNRLGKPNLAFAVLKNGLNKITLNNRSLIPAVEVPSPKPNYMNFDTVQFDLNIGIHARGCGHVEKTTEYAIPSLSSKDDSILYVEDQIKLELALETAFDGNRFHDLMRFAIRRNDPSYLANTVAEKYTDNKEVIRSKLMDMNNWYLP